MRNPAGILSLLLALPTVASGQQLRLAVFGAGGDYREQSSALVFDGTGGAGRLELVAGRFAVSASGSRLAFTRAVTAAGDAEPFVWKELEVTGRVRIASILSIEAGSYRRWIEPDRAAQAIQVTKVGLRADYRLAPGADAGLRAGILGNAKFSGGGSAKAGMALGFGLSFGAKQRGARITADYEFIRLNRQTTVGGPIAVPIQSSTARLGLLLIL